MTMTLTMGVEGCMTHIYGGGEEHLSINGTIVAMDYAPDFRSAGSWKITFDDGTELKFRASVGKLLSTGDRLDMKCTKPEGSTFWEIDEMHEW